MSYFGANTIFRTENAQRFRDFKEVIADMEAITEWRDPINHLKDELESKGLGTNQSEMISTIVEFFSDTNKISKPGVTLWFKLEDREINGIRRSDPKRDKLIGLCFLLGYNAEEADVFLRKYNSENAFHLRNYEEIIYAFYLDYTEEGLSPKDKYKRALAKIDEFRHLSEIRSVNYDERYNYTQMCRNDFGKISTEKDLDDFLNSAELQKRLGEVRCRAQNVFYNNLSALTVNLANCENIDVSEFWEDECVMDMTPKDRYDALREYLANRGNSLKPKAIGEDLFIGFPARNELYEFINLQKESENPLERRKALLLMEVRNRISKDINENEGNSLMRMISGGTEKVSRKHLILILLLNADYTDEIEYKEMNSILDSCGMPLLDINSPFDYLVISAMFTAHNSHTYQSDTLDKLVECVFS